MGHCRYQSLLKHQCAKIAAVGGSVREWETPVIVPRECVLAAAKQLLAEGVIG